MERLEVLRGTKTIVVFLVFVLSTGVLAFSPINSALMESIVISSTGQIQSGTDVTAASGYWRDIQAAIDWVAANGGVGNVYIPEGTFNFVNEGESWSGGDPPTAKITVPAGVSIFGAPTERYANGSVVEWKTRLVIPAEFAPARPSYVQMFRFQGTGDPNKSIRLSDIEFVGYRAFEPTSDRWYSVSRIYNVINFRVDHCFFNNMAGMCVDARAPANGDCNGVIDHCKFVNNWGYVEWAYDQCTVHYAIGIRAIGTTRWDNIDNVLGHYLGYTVFVEDCYFSRWRHCISSNDGVHYVFRHNTIEKDSVVGSIDCHGVYDYVGTRAIEVYDNEIIDPVLNHHPQNWDNTTPSNGNEGYGVNWRGGGGVFFNNLVRGYQVGVYLMYEGYPPYSVHDAYIWNNTFTGNRYNIYTDEPSKVVQDVDYFLYAMPGYTPYPYPHPLTLEKTLE